MAIPNIPSSYSANDNIFLTTLLPSRGRARFVRGAILLFLAIGTLACTVIAARVFLEFHARHSWPIAEGYVTGVRVKSYAGPSSRDRVPHYFVEYQVHFAVPAEQCLTGITVVIDGKPPLCEGIARTRTTNSQALANTWAERNRFNPAVGVLHDPNGPGVKIAGEPASLVYPWTDLLGMSAWVVFFLAFLIMTQRRLRYLESFPDDCDATSPSPSQPARGDDLIDMKLS